MTNPMYGYLAREIEAEAQRYGYRLLIGSTYRDPQKERAFFDDLLSHGVRRVVVISSLSDERHFEQAVERGMAVVSYDRGATPGRPSRVAHVTPDNFEAARLATAHLIACGHRDLGFVTVAGMTMSRRAKIDGFHAAALAVGPQGSARVLDGGPLNEYGDAVIAEVGRTTAMQIVRARRRPTGIVALNDLMALGLLAGLREAGLAVPGEVSVVGLDGHFLSALANPALTTVELPVPEMARAMVDRVMHPRPDAGTEASRSVFAPTRLIERESVAPPPGRSRSRRGTDAAPTKSG
jgi:DNA-binding LacI/PurR family transcriptional regulator